MRMPWWLREPSAALRTKVIDLRCRATGGHEWSEAKYESVMWTGPEDAAIESKRCRRCRLKHARLITTWSNGRPRDPHDPGQESMGW